MPDSVYMVLEFMKGGDLLTRIIEHQRLSERISKLYFYQMCHAVKYLHDKGNYRKDNFKKKELNILLNLAYILCIRFIFRYHSSRFETG